MPDYYVAINRNKVTAATPQEAANLAVTTPLGVGDTSFVKQLDPAGSLFSIPGMRMTGIVGTVPSPDLVVTGGSAANMELPPPPPII